MLKSCTSDLVSGEGCYHAGQVYSVGGWNRSDAAAEPNGPGRDAKLALKLLDRGCQAGVDLEVTEGGLVDGGTKSCCETMAYVFDGQLAGDFSGVSPNPELAAQYRTLIARAEQRNDNFYNSWIASRDAYVDGLQREREQRVTEDQARWRMVEEALGGLHGAIQISTSLPATPEALRNATTEPAPPSNDSCQSCDGQCAARNNECAVGTQRACYEAAACLCQCHLDRGGCGSSTQALSRCISENQESAATLLSEGTAIGATRAVAHPPIKNADSTPAVPSPPGAQRAD